MNIQHIAFSDLKKIIRAEQKIITQSRWLFTQNKSDRLNFTYNKSKDLWWTGDWVGTPQNTDMVAHWIAKEKSLFYGSRAGISIPVGRDEKGRERYKTPMRLKAAYKVVDGEHASYEKLLNPEGSANGPQSYVYWPRTSPPKGRLGSEIKVRQVTTAVKARDAAVSNWVLTRSQGVCEFCSEPAPFVNESGEPYLEVHHIKQLAHGGSDRVSNTVALCPNCHRQFHFGIDKDALKEKVLATITELQSE